MELKCIAIDHDQSALEHIKYCADKTAELQLLNTFASVTEAEESLLINQIDLLIIDINIPQLSEFMASLPYKPWIIFTALYKDDAFKGFEMDAMGFLLKPVEFEKFNRAVCRVIEFNKYQQYSKAGEGESLIVRSEYKMIRIEQMDIEYIEGFVDYIKIHLVDQQTVLTLMTLKAILEKLPADKFKRIHRSYIVLISKIKSIHHKKAVLFSSKELPIGNSYIVFIQEWKSYISRDTLLISK